MHKKISGVCLSFAIHLMAGDLSAGEVKAPTPATAKDTSKAMPKATAPTVAKDSAQTPVAKAAVVPKTAPQDSMRAAEGRMDSLRAARTKMKDSAKARVKAMQDTSKAGVMAKTGKDTAKPAAAAQVLKPEPVPMPKAPAPSVSARPECGVEKIAFGTGIENMELQGEAPSFPPGRAYAWSRLKCGWEPVKVRHAWYRDGKKAQDVPLSCRSGMGRVWSNAPVSPGRWKVEVLTETGDLMGSGEMTVE